MGNILQTRWIENIYFIVLAVTLTLAMTCHTPSKCCLRYQQGKSSRCMECIPGYFGPYCNYPCRYPTYGRECQLQCLCDVPDCDYVHGCRRKDCPSGYQGPFCSEKCRYPNYGIKCQSGCLCEEQHCNHIMGCLTLISSEEIPSTLPTEFKRQDRLMLSNQTTTISLRKESTRKGDDWYLPYQEDKSWRVNKVFVYCIIGLMFIAVLLLCLHVLLYFVN
nr:protein draper-like [Crassostrea gigas]